jgi:hypothetical protein
MAVVPHFFGWDSPSLASGQTAYAHMGGGAPSMFTIAGGQAQRQAKLHVAGKIQHLGVMVSANTITTSPTTVTLQVNGSDTAAVISIPAGATGWRADTTNQVAIAAGDKVNLKVVTPATSGSITFAGCTWEFDAAVGTTGFLIGPMLSVTSNGITRYYTPGTSNGQLVTEADSQTIARAGATLRNLCVNVQTARAVVDTFSARINTAAGAGGLSAATSTVAGFYEDTTHSESLAVGDKFNIRIVFGASASTLVFLPSVQVDFAGTDQFMVGGSGTAGSAGSTNYHFIGGTNRVLAATTGAAAQQSRHGTYSNAWVYVASNGATADSTYKSQKNGSDGAISIPILASTPGLYEDTTHSDDVVNTDTYYFKSTIGTGGTVLIGGTSIKFTPKTPVAGRATAEPQAVQRAAYW